MRDLTEAIIGKAIVGGFLLAVGGAAFGLHQYQASKDEAWQATIEDRVEAQRTETRETCAVLESGDLDAIASLPLGASCPRIENDYPSTGGEPPEGYEWWAGQENQQEIPDNYGIRP